jgi:murein DD-endopeptidase MepM/ murein hydrolase activator NlpD
MFRRLLAAAVLALGVALLGPAPARADAGWVWPVRGAVITPYRNGDDPYAAGQHRGIDIAATVGAQVVAATAGEVRFAGTAGSSGLTVSIRTADGRFDTSYLHLASIAVSEGDRLAAGDRIGAVGTTGKRSADEPHLHFGVRDAGTDHGYHDPLAYLPPPPAPAPRPEPAPAPAPEPARPAPAPHAVPRRAPHPGRLPLPTPAPHRAPSPTDLPLVAADPVPKLGKAPSGAPQEEPQPLQAAPSTHPSTHPTPGPDLGWALACAGLLLAAGLLGLTEDGRTASRHGRGRIAAALQPLSGRRP